MNRKSREKKNSRLFVPFALSGRKFHRYLLNKQLSRKGRETDIVPVQFLFLAQETGGTADYFLSY